MEERVENNRMYLKYFFNEKIEDKRAVIVEKMD